MPELLETHVKLYHHLFIMTDIKPILYSFRRCPYAMRARMALKYAQVDFELRDILLKNKPQSLLTYSPKATVPVLVLTNQVIDESLEIMQWALTIKDCKGWQTAPNQLEIINLCDIKFKAQLDKYKYSDRHEHSEYFYRDEAMWYLELLNHTIGEKKNLFVDAVSFADIAIFPFIRQFAFVNKPWFDSLPLAGLHRWLERHLQSELFQTIMIKNKIWSEAN